MKPIVALFAAACVAGAITPVIADGNMATEISAPPNAPVVLTRCKFSDPIFGGTSWYTALNVVNRSAHALISYTVDYRFYDQDNTQLGQARYTYTPPTPLSPHDTGSYNDNTTMANLSEGPTAVSRVTCRVTEAHLSGRNIWTPTASWHGGALDPLPRTSASRGPNAQRSGSNRSDAVADAPTAQRVELEVTNSWNDVTASNGIFVHDTVVMRGGDHDSTVRPQNLVLRMALTSGAKKTYTALAQQAPQYQRLNPLTGQYQTGYQVDPQNDFGHMGSIIVPAHGTVTLTATFSVPDAVVDANANRNVTLQ